MRKDTYEYPQSTDPAPIDLIAEQHLRKSEFYAEHSRVRRKNVFNMIGNTLRTVFKEGLIISSPGLSSLSSDMGDMEAYRRFLEGTDKETPSV